MEESNQVEFRNIPEFSGYRAGSDGNLWRFKRYHDSRYKPDQWIKMASSIKRNGYREATMVVGDKRFYRLVHRLVLEAFVGPCPPGMEACHNNGNRLDNRIENLRWDIHENNMRDKVLHGTLPQGSTVVTSKLEESDIPKILRLLEAGVARHRIAYGFGVSPNTIDRIANGHSWKHLTDTSQKGMRRCLSNS